MVCDIGCDIVCDTVGDMVCDIVCDTVCDTGLHKSIHLVLTFNFSREFFIRISQNTLYSRLVWVLLKILEHFS